jgi:hypothetical protein
VPISRCTRCLARNFAETNSSSGGVEIGQVSEPQIPPPCPDRQSRIRDVIIHQGFVDPRSAKARRIAAPLETSTAPIQPNLTSPPPSMHPPAFLNPHLPYVQPYGAVPSPCVPPHSAGVCATRSSLSWPWFGTDSRVSQSFTLPHYYNAEPFQSSTCLPTAQLAVSLPKPDELADNTPDSVAATPTILPEAVDILHRSVKHRYHCRRCGKYKRGHVCSVRRKTKRLTFPKRAKFAPPCE